MFFFWLERWKDIVGYEGLYEVSDFGRVRSLDRVLPRKDGRSCSFRGRIIMQASTTTCKYLVVDLCKDSHRKHHLAHILVAKAFLGEYEKGLEVNHKDGNIYNNHISNLEVVTHAENIRHSIVTGLKQDYGEKHVHAKFTNEQANIIRFRVKNGEKQKDLAHEFGVNKQTICSIVNYKTYTK